MLRKNTEKRNSSWNSFGNQRLREYQLLKIVLYLEFLLISHMKIIKVVVVLICGSIIRIETSKN
jgi:hypothetical protein